MRKAVAISGLLALGLLSSAALASGWSDFEAAFPVTPCQDGWVGCIVDGKAVTPDMMPKGGVPMPADLRVGWFDLEGTRTFSPFPGLSEYTGEAPPSLGGDGVTDAGGDDPDMGGDDPDMGGDDPDMGGDDPDELPPLEPADPPEDRTSTNRTGGDDTRTTTNRNGTADPDPGDSRTSTNRTGNDGGTRTTTNRTTSTSDPGTPDPRTGGGTPISALDGGTSKTPDETVSSIIKKDPVAVPQGCANIKALEPKAMLGKLSNDQTKCLEGELSKAGKQTDKNKISRVLMTNAWSSGDKRTWEKHVKRHLDEIDRSDPDICYKYALHLARKGTGASYGVIKWADVALENRTVWTGSTYTNRVNSLYKLKAAAAQKLWQSAENKYTEDASDANLAKRDKTRNMTKVYAREWYEYAKSAGKDSSAARALCISAAGTEDYCEGS